MAGVVIGLGTVALGSFVAAKIEDNAVQNDAAATALYVNSLNAPYLQELTSGPALSKESLHALEASFNGTELGRQVVSIKIWRPDGRVVYSNRRDFIGKTFAASPKLLKALKGEVAAQFVSSTDGADTGDRDPRTPLLETYVPVHAIGNDRIIAVAELLTDAGPLKTELRMARLQSWIVAGALALLQVILLYGIVSRGNKTIESQRAALVNARSVSVETSERLLRRVGADLHDGPAQLISLALLRLDSLRPLLAAEHSKPAEFEKIRSVLQDCLWEIRHLSAGLAPPHLDCLSLDKALELAVRQHEQRTGTTVNATIGALAATVSPQLKASIYRFVQEGLNNAYRHAAGAGQMVHVVSSDNELSIEVADNGPGFSPSKIGSGDGLGLAGLRDRVESLGGKFYVDSQPGSGTRVRATFQVADNRVKDA
jgi:signal transduction histidine kinase